MPETNILFVGHDRGSADQIAALTSGSHWQLNRTADAAAAADIVMQRHISVVVAGFGDDLKACAELFRRMRHSCPGAIRLAMIPERLGIGADLAVLSAHQVIATNSADAAAQKVLVRAESVLGKLRDQQPLESLFSKVTTVPTPPALYFKVRDEINSPGGDAHSIATLIARDAALTARILRIVNSGFFALPSTIADLAHAIALLGTQTVLGLVLSVELYKGLPVPGINMDTVWKHAFAVSAVAKRLCQELHGTIDEVNASGVAGLLHDIGSLILLANFPASYPGLVRRANGDEEALRLLELESLGADHAQLGGLMLDLWCLPDAVVAAVSEHHGIAAQAYEAARVSSRAVLLAEWLVNSYTRYAAVLPREEDFSCPYPIEYAQYARWWQFCADASSGGRP